MKREIKLEIDEFESDDQLAERDLQLVKVARAATANAYAPYSGFRVAAAARLEDGTIVTGTNQENASYPVGICAERTLLSTIGSLYPNAPIETIAITYYNSKGDSSNPVAPCGICRQSLLEYENRTTHQFRLILAGYHGKAIIIENASSLLPLSFSAADMEIKPVA